MKLKPTADAARHGAQAPAAEPTLPEALAAAIDHLRSERIEAAEPELLRILQRWPGQGDALHFLGVLRHTQGRIDEAVSLIQAALEQDPTQAGAWNNLGNVLLMANRAEEAADAYSHAVEQAPSGTNGVLAMNNLGVLYRQLHRLDLSEQMLRRALETDPQFADGWYNLARTLIQRGQIQEGTIAHSKARALWPAHLQPRSDVIRALLLLGERERAAVLLNEWLAESPDNPVALHMLAACQTGEAPARASDGYVEQVFDQFATSFDAKLEALGYRAPELVAQALAAAAGPGQAQLDIIDAGCGTGLCGPLIKPWARHLAGCDLSTGMLRLAKARKVYDTLHKAELTHYLDTQPGAGDAVVSADTLCYFGQLDTVLAATWRCLRPGGWLVFTVEGLAETDERPHLLQANGRYAHARHYLDRSLEAAGFVQRTLVRERLRMEAGEPVMGWVVSARSPLSAEGRHL